MLLEVDDNLVEVIVSMSLQIEQFIDNDRILQPVLVVQDFLHQNLHINIWVNEAQIEPGKLEPHQPQHKQIQSKGTIDLGNFVPPIDDGRVEGFEPPNLQLLVHENDVSQLEITVVDSLELFNILQQYAGVFEEVVNVLGLDSTDIDSVGLPILLGDDQFEVVVGFVGEVLDSPGLDDV